jgi:hypothetical protein
MCQVGTFTELAVGVGVGEGPLFGVGVGDGDGEAAFTPPQPATASTAAAVAIMVAIFWRRSDGREEEIWEMMSKVELTAAFMAPYPFLAGERFARNHKSFASYGASTRVNFCRYAVSGKMQQLWTEMCLPAGLSNDFFWPPQTERNN